MTVLVLIKDAYGLLAPEADLGIHLYRLYADVWLVGILPVTLYPFLGGKVWCRYWCPLAKLMQTPGAILYPAALEPVQDRDQRQVHRLQRMLPQLSGRHRRDEFRPEAGADRQPPDLLHRLRHLRDRLSHGRAFLRPPGPDQPATKKRLIRFQSDSSITRTRRLGGAALTPLPRTPLQKQAVGQRPLQGDASSS